MLLVHEFNTNIYLFSAQSIGKAPSTIKTNIKSAASTHPYQRP